MKFSERLDALLTEQHKSLTDLARFLNVTPQAAHQWAKGVTEPRGKRLKEIAEFFGLTESELVYGAPRVSRPVVFPKGTTGVVSIDDNTESPEYMPIRKVRLRLSAGITGFAIEQSEDAGNPIFFRTDWMKARGYKADNLVAIPVSGQSMEPTMSDGDTVVINTMEDIPKDGKVFAVNYEGEAVIKRLVRDAGEWWLTSDNPDSKRFPKKACIGESCIIIGRVVHLQTEIF